MLPHPRIFAHRLLTILILATVAVGGVLPSTGRVHAGQARASSDTLTIGWDTETRSLDPGANPQNPDIWVMVNIYDQLLRPSADGTKLVPDLATRWEITNGGTVYTFHLRPDAMFTNGAKVTAGDVKFALDRIREKSNPWAFLYVAIKNIQVLDPLTVRLNLSHPWAPLLSDVSAFAAAVYPEAYFKKVGSAYMGAHPIGSGPYMFDTWVKGQYLRLTKNPNYWNASLYPMQHIEYDLIPDDNSRLLKVESGELDVDNVLAFNLVPQVRASQTASVKIDKSTETYYFAANEQLKTFADVNVRQAINHAIDRAAFAKIVTQGLGTPANSFMPAGALYQNPNLPIPAHDLSLAKQYLAKSAFPHGFSMDFNVGASDLVCKQEAVLFQGEVAPLGITVKIVPQDKTTLFNNQQVGKYSLTCNLWTNDIPDPDELVAFTMDYTAGSYSFFTWYKNPEATNLSHQGEQANDPATRKKIYYQIQDLWARDTPTFALVYVPFVNAVNNHVHGFSENPLGYFNIVGVTKS
jgi:peptide/nickel transport system substrate-binding protein